MVSIQQLPSLNLLLSLLHKQQISPPSMQTPQFQSLLHKLTSQTHSFPTSDIKTQILHLYSSNPSLFCQSLISLIMHKNQQKRQQGIYLLNQIAKPPHYLHLFNENIVSEAEIEIAKTFFEDYGNCTLRYKAVGILYSRVLNVSKIQLIQENMFVSESSTLPWLKCLTQLLTHLKTTDWNCYSAITNIFTQCLKMNRLTFDQQVQQVFQCYQNYIILAKTIYPEYRLQLLRQCLTLLASLINKYQSFPMISKGICLYYHICKSLSHTMTYKLLVDLFQHTQNFFNSIDVIDVWIQLIEQLDFKFFQSEVESSSDVRSTFEQICFLMIKNIDTIEYLSVTFNKKNVEVSYNSAFILTSAELLISILKKLNISSVKSLIKQKTSPTNPTISNPNLSKLSKNLYFVIHCCSLLCKFQQPEFNSILNDIFNNFHYECRLLQLESPNKLDIQMIKVILFGIGQLLDNYNSEIIKIKPTLLTGIYSFILKIINYDLDKQLLCIIRETFSELMKYGEKYFINKASNRELKTIVNEFVFKPYPNEGYGTIKDIIVDFGIEILKKKTSREERMMYLSEFNKIVSMKCYREGSGLDECTVCKFCTAVVEQLGEMRGLERGEYEFVQRFVNWMLRQMREGCVMLLETFGVMFKLNYQLVSEMTTEQNTQVLMLVGAKNPTLYFPIWYQKLSRQYNQQTSNLLLQGILNELNENKFTIQKLKKLLSILTISYQFPNFPSSILQIIQTLFLLLSNNNNFTSTLTNNYEYRYSICSTISSLLISSDNENNFECIKQINLKHFIDFLRGEGGSFGEANYSVSKREIELRMVMVNILAYFVGAKARDKGREEEIEEIAGFCLRIWKSVPMGKMLECEEEGFERVMRTMRIAVEERAAAMGIV